MLVRFWGTRGSVPAPGPQTVRYGGNTSCLEVRGADDRLVVLDAGTGIRELGRALERQASGGAVHVELFVTHAHWDHIQGLPFFAPLYAPGASVTIRGPERLTTPLEQVLDTMLAPAVFPVGRASLRARLEFPRIGREPVDVGTTRVLALPALHPGGAVGFRVEVAGTPERSLVYFPDNEVRAPSGPMEPDEWRRRFLDFARDAGVLVHDAMYTAGEYAGRSGWGHSTVADAVRLAADARVPHLVLFHHAPERDDGAVDRLLAEARALASELGAPLRVDAAVEGAVLEL